MTDHLNTGPFSLCIQRTIKNQLVSSSVGVGYRSQWRDLDSLPHGTGYIGQHIDATRARKPVIYMLMK